jgi:tRNA-binding protein
VIGIDDLLALDVRVGRIVRAEPFPEARRPALKLWVDLGPEIGERASSAQIAARYDPEALPGRLVLAVVNLAPRRIGPFTSEVLVLGVPDEAGEVVLIAPDTDVPLGGRLY